MSKQGSKLDASFYVQKGLQDTEQAASEGNELDLVGNLFDVADDDAPMELAANSSIRAPDQTAVPWGFQQRHGKKPKGKAGKGTSRPPRKAADSSLDNTLIASRHAQLSSSGL